MSTETLQLVERPDYKITVTVQYPDSITHKYYIVIETSVYDEYNKVWLDPRQTKIFLDDDEMYSLGVFLAKQSILFPDTMGEDQ